MSVIRNFMRGVQAIGWGLAWLGRRPLYALLLFVPMVLAVFIVVAGWGFYWRHSDQFFAWVLMAPPESGFFAFTWYYLLKGAWFVGLVLTSILALILCINVLSAPIYDYVSVAVERQITGRVEEVSIWKSLRLVGEELKKVAVVLLLSGGILLIPVFNILAPVVAAFCLAWEVYDYPLARRGWTFRQRWTFVLRNSPSLLGLGVWLLIPGVQIFIVPLAIVGATKLAIEDLGLTKKL